MSPSATRTKRSYSPSSLEPSRMRAFSKIADCMTPQAPRVLTRTSLCDGRRSFGSSGPADSIVGGPIAKTLFGTRPSHLATYVLLTRPSIVLAAIPILKSRDLVTLRQGVLELVKAIDQAIFGEWVDFERVRWAIRQRDRLRFEIHPDRQVRSFGDPRQQIRNDRLRQPDGEEAVLDAIGVEDIAEARRDNDFEPVVGEGPDSILARGATSEIDIGDHDARITVMGLVERKLWAFCSVHVEAQVVEQILAEAAAAGLLQKTRRNDLVCVDIWLKEWGRRRFQTLERLHFIPRAASCARRSDDLRQRLRQPSGGSANECAHFFLAALRNSCSRSTRTVRTRRPFRRSCRDTSSNPLRAIRIPPV